MKLRRKSLIFFLFLIFIICSQNILIFYLLQSNKNLVHYPLYLLFTRTIFITILIFFPSLFFFSRKKILRPLEMLEESARLYRTENKIFPLPLKAVDEISSLSQSIREMIESLEEQQNLTVQEEKLKSLGLMAAGIAHEINNPIGYIQSNQRSFEKYMEKIKQGLELLPAEDRNQLKINNILEDLEELLEDNKNGIEKIHKIVKSMNSFSHGEHHSVPAPIDLNSLIKETLNLTGFMKEPKVIIDLNLTPLPEVNARKSQIEQVLLNLLLNAKFYAPRESGNIKISTWAEEGTVFCRIEDNGPGIPWENQNKIFDPFYTTKAPGEGTGLGLNISYNIMMRHGGNIQAGSSDLGGAALTMALPT
ncbi:MAG: HAMP domain-containing sensor histidine kinase [Spirochaetales bacterium]|nr:HAMP domain-containing sensor histidine kinase [Spirochaetales bacterium]